VGLTPISPFQSFFDLFWTSSQGVALGYPMSPRWGGTLVAEPHIQFAVAYCFIAEEGWFKGGMKWRALRLTWRPDCPLLPPSGS
jgi:hypothetical protein